MQMFAVGEAAPLNETSSALLILKGRLDSHAPCVFTHPLMRSWPIREQHPRVLVSWFPARGFASRRTDALSTVRLLHTTARLLSSPPACLVATLDSDGAAFVGSTPHF